MVSHEILHGFPHGFPMDFTQHFVIPAPRHSEALRHHAGAARGPRRLGARLLRLRGGGCLARKNCPSATVIGLEWLMVYD